MNQDTCKKRLQSPLYNTLLTSNNNKDLKINIFKERNSGGNKGNLFIYSSKNKYNQISCKKSIYPFNKETFKDIIGANYPETNNVK